MREDRRGDTRKLGEIFVEPESSESLSLVLELRTGSSSHSDLDSELKTGSGLLEAFAGSPPCWSVKEKRGMRSRWLPCQPKQPSSSEWGSKTQATCSGAEKKFLWMKVWWSERKMPKPGCE